MKSITNIKDLKAAITVLEQKKMQEEILFKTQFNKTFESLNPVHLITSSIKELLSAPELKQNILSTLVSLAAGYFSKKLAIGAPKNRFKEVIGGGIQLLVTGIVSKNSKGILAKITDIVNLVFNKEIKTKIE